MHSEKCQPPFFLLKIQIYSFHDFFYIATDIENNDCTQHVFKFLHWNLANKDLEIFKRIKLQGTEEMGCQLCGLFSPYEANLKIIEE